MDKVSASAQNQALNAVVFLYRQALKQDLSIDINAVQAKDRVRGQGAEEPVGWSRMHQSNSPNSD